MTASALAVSMLCTLNHPKLNPSNQVSCSQIYGKRLFFSKWPQVAKSARWLAGGKGLVEGAGRLRRLRFVGPGLARRRDPQNAIKCTSRPRSCGFWKGLVGRNMAWAGHEPQVKDLQRAQLGLIRGPFRSLYPALQHYCSPQRRRRLLPPPPPPPPLLLLLLFVLLLVVVAVACKSGRGSLF